MEKFYDPVAGIYQIIYGADFFNILYSAWSLNRSRSGTIEGRRLQPLTIADTSLRQNYEGFTRLSFKDRPFAQHQHRRSGISGSPCFRDPRGAQEGFE